MQIEATAVTYILQVAQETSAGTLLLIFYTKYKVISAVKGRLQ